MILIFLIPFILLVILSIALGLFLFLSPALAIDIQKKFYRRINWNIEPLSQKKEIRNTKIMGLGLISATILIVLLAIFRPELILSIFK